MLSYATLAVLISLLTRRTHVPRNLLCYLSEWDKFIKFIRHLNTIVRGLMCQENAQAIVVRGTSGVSVAYALKMLNPHLRVVITRKPNEQAHSKDVVPCGNFQYLSSAEFRYIFLDDLICPGNTLNAAIKEMRKHYPHSEIACSLYYQSLQSQVEDGYNGTPFARLAVDSNFGFIKEYNATL